MIIKFQDYKNNPFKKGIANFCLLVCCQKCGLEKNYIVKQYRRRDWNKEELCGNCYLDKRCYRNPDWIQKNSQAQLIAQNKPEQKKKNAIGVSKSWDKERKRKASKLMQCRWGKASKAEKKKMLQNLEWTQKSDKKFNQIMAKSHKSKSGVYHGLFYNSLLELAFILVCEARKINIKRYDLEPIPYQDEQGKIRYYHPDFIIHDKVVAEIKGHVFNKDGGEFRLDLKNKAASIFLKERGLKFKLFFRSKFIKSKLKIAKLIHEDC